MKTIITNVNKMKDYINQYSFDGINKGDFNNWTDYLEEYAGWIAEAPEELDGNTVYANLTLTIEDIDYYVDVIFVFDFEENIVEIDLDYEAAIQWDEFDLRERCIKIVDSLKENQ